MRVRAYCELAFLDELFEAAARPSSPLDRVLNADRQQEDLERLTEFVFDRCRLLIDDMEEFLRRAQGLPYYKRMLKASQSGASRVEAASGDTVTATPIALPTVELLSNASDHSASSNCRLPLSTSKHLHNIRHLTNARSCQVDTNVERNEFGGWRAFAEDIHPVSTIVVADQYLYHKSVKVNHNVKHILQALLPDAAKVTIVVLVNDDLRDRRDKILKNLQSYLSKHHAMVMGEIHVQTVRSQDFHDRFILLDYALITSGHSLDYYNEKGKLKKVTTLTLTGLATSTGDQYSAVHAKVCRVLAKGRPDWDQAVGRVDGRIASTQKSQTTR